MRKRKVSRVSAKMSNDEPSTARQAVLSRQVLFSALTIPNAKLSVLFDKQNFLPYFKNQCAFLRNGWLTLEMCDTVTGATVNLKNTNIGNYDFFK